MKTSWECGKVLVAKLKYNNPFAMKRMGCRLKIMAILGLISLEGILLPSYIAHFLHHTFLSWSDRYLGFQNTSQ